MPIPRMPVGWNWKNSMSWRGMPRRASTAGPSPVLERAFEVVRNIRPEAAGSDKDRGSAEYVEVAGGQLISNDAAAFPSVNKQINEVKLIKKGHVTANALLVERLKDHVAGTIGREARPERRGLAKIPRMPAEAPLVDAALRGPVERKPAVLQVVYRPHCVFGKDYRRPLVHQVIAALDGVECVPFGPVFFHVA